MNPIIKMDKEKNSFCTICSKSYKSEKLLMIHTKAKHQKTEHNKKCKLCDNMEFNTIAEYEVHVIEVHNGQETHNFICSECGKQFKTKGALSVHIKSKCNTIKLFKCNQCEKEFKSAGALFSHTLKHTGKKDFMCKYCAKLFYTAGMLERHERVHTQEKIFFCDYCGKGFSHRESLITHNSLHTGIKPYLCENCGKSFSCIGNLLKHRKTHKECNQVPLRTHTIQNPELKLKRQINTPVSVKLKRAQKEKELQEKLKIYKQRIEEEKVNLSVPEDKEGGKTNEEGEKFEEEKLLLNVPEDKFEVVDKKDEEKEVDKKQDGVKTEKQNESIKINFEEVNVDKIDEPPENKFDIDFIKEEDTDYEIKDPVGLDEDNESDYGHQHKISQNVIVDAPRQRMRRNKEFSRNSPEPTNTKIKCSICKFVCKTKQDITNHRRQKHAHFLVCIGCDKVYENVEALKAHQVFLHELARTKTDKSERSSGRRLKRNRSHTCGTCGKTFSSDFKLNIHKRSHDEKTISCKFCGKLFRNESQLRIHERSHTGEKPFACTHCPKAFAYKQSLTIHLNTHGGVKPFECKACRRRFSCNGNLTKHKVSHFDTCGVWYSKNENVVD